MATRNFEEKFFRGPESWGTYFLSAKRKICGIYTGRADYLVFEAGIGVVDPKVDGPVLFGATAAHTHSRFGSALCHNLCQNLNLSEHVRSERFGQCSGARNFVRNGQILSPSLTRV